MVLFSPFVRLKVIINNTLRTYNFVQFVFLAALIRHFKLLKRFFINNYVVNYVKVNIVVYTAKFNVRYGTRF